MVSTTSARAIVPGTAQIKSMSVIGACYVRVRYGVISCFKLALVMCSVWPPIFTRSSMPLSI